jgi:hypothetical protein
MSRSRKLVALALAAAAIGALVVAQAFAATTSWSGSGTNDTVWKLTFKKEKLSGHPAHVKNWNSKQLRFTCTDASTFRADTNIASPITVQNGEFSRTRSFTNGNVKVTYTINGEFVNATTATGTYKEKRALVSDPSVHCDSRREPWRTRKQ